MAEINQQQTRALQHGGRLKWTKLMNSDLLKCKRRAKEMATSNVRERLGSCIWGCVRIPPTSRPTGLTQGSD